MYMPAVRLSGNSQVLPQLLAALRSRLVVEVENPIPDDDLVGQQAGQRGNHIAVDNIAQRLALIYGDQARLEMGKDPRLDGPVFRVRLSLPESPRNGEFI